MEPMEGASSLERVLCAQAARTKTPINGSLELLPLCNMNCDMCYVRLSREEMERQGRLRTVDEWLEIARQMNGSGVLFLLLTGGEPLLYPGFRRLYLELLKLGLIITINTNGTLIDDETARFFGKNKPRRINITLYGSDDNAYRELCHYPGGFKKATDAVRLLRKYGVDVKINGSLTVSNQNDWQKIIELGNKLDAPVRIDTYMYPATRERDKPYNNYARLSPEKAAETRIKILREEMGEETFKASAERTLYIKNNTPKGEDKPRPVHCMAGRSSFTVNWQGEMRPCVVMTSPAANIAEMGFEAAWRYIVSETEKIFESSKCSVCTLRDICQTCAACALAEEGSYSTVPEYMCRYTHRSVECIEEALKGINALQKSTADDII